MNMEITTDVTTAVTYVAVFLIMWYAIIWITRFAVSIIWPLFLVASAIVVFRILQFYEPNEIKSMVHKVYTIIADSLVMVMARALEIVLHVTK